MPRFDSLPEHTFVGITELMGRYGRGKTWVCRYVAQTGFPGEVGHRSWRLDHVISFELMQGVSAASGSAASTASPALVFAERAGSAANSFVGVKELGVRYQRGKTWVCGFVNQAGFPGEIGARVWRLDHVMAFEDELGAVVRSCSSAPRLRRSSVVAQAVVIDYDDDILTRRRNRRKAA